jgi:hypothetical protein
LIPTRRPSRCAASRTVTRLGQPAPVDPVTYAERPGRGGGGADRRHRQRDQCMTISGTDGAPEMARRLTGRLTGSAAGSGARAGNAGPGASEADGDRRVRCPADGRWPNRRRWPSRSRGPWPEGAAAGSGAPVSATCPSGLHRQQVPIQEDVRRQADQPVRRRSRSEAARAGSRPAMAHGSPQLRRRRTPLDRSAPTARRHTPSSTSPNMRLITGPVGRSWNEIHSRPPRPGCPPPS